MTDRDIFLIEVSRRGRDGDYAGASDVAALDTRVDTLEARPDITSLDAVPDVTITSPLEGQVLRRNSDGQWVNDTVANGITLQDDGGGDVRIGVTNIVAWRGINVSAPGIPDPTVAYLDVNFAGTGATYTAARSDHYHTTPVTTVYPFAATGVISSGSRTLKSESIVLAAGVTYNLELDMRLSAKCNGAGSGYITLALQIAGGTWDVSEQFQTVGGVPRDCTHVYAATVVGTGAAVSFNGYTTYASGDGVDIRAGKLIVRAKPNR